MRKMKFCRGKDCNLFDKNIFDYEWIKTGKKTIEKDPMHNKKIEFEWYQVNCEGEIKTFAFGEISPEQYMFLYE